MEEEKAPMRGEGRAYMNRIYQFWVLVLFTFRFAFPVWRCTDTSARTQCVVKKGQPKTNIAAPPWELARGAANLRFYRFQVP